MGYSIEVLKRARAELARQREDHISRNNARVERVYRELPRVRQIDMELRQTMVQVYEAMFGKAPQIVSIHAGLECGLLGQKLPGLDCISIGPDMQDIHTSREKLSIASTERTWNFLLAVLKAL